MKTIIIIALLAFTLSCTCACIKRVNSNRTLVNTILGLYPEYRVEVLEDDPNCLLIRIEK